MNHRSLPIKTALTRGKFSLPLGFKSAPDEELAAMGSRLMSGLERSVDIRIDNVTEYLFAGTEQERWPLESFPCLAPPFPAMWFETVPPSGIRSSEPPWTLPENLRHFLTPDVQRTVRNRVPRGWGVLLVSFEREEDEIAWESHANLFIHEVDGRIVGPLAEWRYLVGNDGLAIRRDDEFLLDDGLVECFRWLPEPDALNLASDSTSPKFFPVFLALSFLHCRNVQMVEQFPTRQERRARERRHEPAIRFYTLEIDPMRRVLHTEGKSDDHGLKRALHICRGHFSHYTEDKPLFGKYAGTFWKPAHVRGTADAGHVFKDYAVTSPEEARR